MFNLFDTLELMRLRRFKQYVHDRLDAAGVAKHEDIGNGCRIGARLDDLLNIGTVMFISSVGSGQASGGAGGSGGSGTVNFGGGGGGSGAGGVGRAIKFCEYCGAAEGTPGTIFALRRVAMPCNNGLHKKQGEQL